MTDELIEAARKSLERVQSFDLAMLPGTERLGQELNFREAIPSAEKLIRLLQQFPSQFIADLSASRIETIRTSSDSIFSILNEMLEFDTKLSDAYGRRAQLIESLTRQYDPTFENISPLIAYGSSRLRDFSALEREARSGVQAAKDEASAAVEQLKESQDEAKRILEEVRRVAAEQGVSQQATYFMSEGEKHETEATTWRTWTIYLACGLAGYAAASMFLHKIPWLIPVTTYDALQLGLSKVLIFGVVAYMLLLAARNFLAHKHNSIVNRHRYNALLTFQALADAAGREENRDIVLTHASSCIFSPQETGYSKTQSSTDSQTNIIQTLPRFLPSGNTGS